MIGGQEEDARSNQIEYLDGDIYRQYGVRVTPPKVAL